MAKIPDPLEQAIAGEKAAALGLSARRLAKSLDALRRFDAETSTRSRRTSSSRERLVEEAAEACWGYLIQREIIGLGAEDAEYIRQEYAVPDDVWMRLGPKSRVRR
jgi:hypothetical protein